LGRRYDSIFLLMISKNPLPPFHHLFAVLVRSKRGESLNKCHNYFDNLTVRLTYHVAYNWHVRSVAVPSVSKTRSCLFRRPKYTRRRNQPFQRSLLRRVPGTQGNVFLHASQLRRRVRPIRLSRTPIPMEPEQCRTFPTLNSRKRETSVSKYVF
jgi:hypothetical protein